ncbi:dTDP-glucose 4,6-dehydratase [bacterium]|nr:dTDP-glucose 4,6-dehydratase [bacterium]
MSEQRLLITGGAGFIGSHFVGLIRKKYPHQPLVILDKLTYAGNLRNLKEVLNTPHTEFIRGDITDYKGTRRAMKDCAGLINFAAETHVDRSLKEPAPFINSNYVGTYNLLELARELHLESFIQISTDEVYGPCLEGAFNEEDSLKPTNPYAASKAAADLLCRAYWQSYQVPVTIVRSTNNYGPRQYPEKFIPTMIGKGIKNEPLPIYGDGKHIRDWIFVEDNCQAILLVWEKGMPGEIYNVGSDGQRENLNVAELILERLERSNELISHVPDRPGHDRRYALKWSKIKALGWQPRTSFDDGLKNTVKWYMDNPHWWV